MFWCYKRNLYGENANSMTGSWRRQVVRSQVIISQGFYYAA